MKESGIDVGTAKTQLDESCYYRWDEPNSDITVSLKPETVDRLQIDVLRGLGSGPRAAKEVGGILLGWTGYDKGRLLTVVEDFEPVPCGQRNSTSYALNGKDLVQLEAALARGRANKAGSVVGYYRSHNRTGLYLSPDDLRLIQRYFPGPDNLFLLIKTLPNRACTAGFFFWKDGRIQSEFTDSEAPLIPVSLSTAGQTLPADVGAGVLLAPAAPPQAGSSRTNHRRLIGAILLTGAAAAALIAVVEYRAPRHLRRSDASERPPVVVLQQVPIPAAVRAPESITKKSSRALAVPKPAKEESLQDLNQAAIPIPLESKLPKPAPAGEGTVPNSSAAAESKTPAPKPPVVAAESPLKIPADKPAEAPIAPPVEPPASQPNPTAPALAVPPAEAVIPKPPETTDPQAGHTFLGPKVIHQVAPAVPRGVGPRITTDVQVDVEVRIDASGKVTAARVASTQGAAAQLLTIEALKAAQMFRFQPAREDGRDVPGTMVLTFRFEPTAKANKE